MGCFLNSNGPLGPVYAQTVWLSKFWQQRDMKGESMGFCCNKNMGSMGASIM